MFSRNVRKKNFWEDLGYTPQRPLVLRNRLQTKISLWRICVIPSVQQVCINFLFLRSGSNCRSGKMPNSSIPGCNQSKVFKYQEKVCMIICSLLCSLCKPVRLLLLSLVLLCIGVYIWSVYSNLTSEKTFALSYLSSFLLKGEELMIADQHGDFREVLRLLTQFPFCSDFWILFGSQPVSLQSHRPLCHPDSRAWWCWHTFTQTLQKAT